MSKTEVIIVLALVVLVGSNIVRFVLLSRWIDRLNDGLPPGEQFQLIGWWTPAERMRAWRRWREIRKANK